MSAHFGLIGLGVMGENLALNLADHGVALGVWDRDAPVRDAFRRNHASRAEVSSTLSALVASLERPRRLLMMITAGPAVDAVLNQLESLLERGDVVIDGGNSRFQDTRRRDDAWRGRGLHFVGMGVSGGEEGARRGPSLMPGGSAAAWELLQPTLESIAAVTEAGPCVTHIGPDGAGHFVKMVHNGIEYADMQLIAEAYDLSRRLHGLDPDELASMFASWNEGPLESFLVEITAEILGVRAEDGSPLVESVLDRAGQKGTGRWTVETALEYAVPVPTIAAALDARVLSSLKDERVTASRVIDGTSPETRARTGGLDALRDALLAGKACAYAQGMALIRAASDEYTWGIDRAELARIWKGGCILRARFLDRVRAAFGAQPDLANLLVDPELRADLPRWGAGLRATVADAVAAGIPVPALGASLAYLDAYRTADLPQNLVQAQRDAFGAHTYVRRDDPGGAPVHTDWLSAK